MRRVALILRADAVEGVLDGLMPLLPGGVYERAIDEERMEIAFYVAAGDPPDRPAVEAMAGDALLGLAEEEVPDGVGERRRRAGSAWEVDGRLRVRSPTDPPGEPGVPEIVVERAQGAFGTGAHPTTRMCLEVLLDLEPGGAFADLGCGAGVLSVAAAMLGWDPVFAVDHEPRSVEATRRNAERNGVVVRAVEADLSAVPPPPAATIAANIPLTVHARIASELDPAVERVIVSGLIRDQVAEARECYEAAGLTELTRLGQDGWDTLLMGRA